MQNDPQSKVRPRHKVETDAYRVTLRDHQVSQFLGRENWNLLEILPEIIDRERGTKWKRLLFGDFGANYWIYAMFILIRLFSSNYRIACDNNQKLSQ